MVPSRLSHFSETVIMVRGRPEAGGRFDTTGGHRKAKGMLDRTSAVESLFFNKLGCRMPSYLNFTRRPYEEPYHLNLLVSAGNSSTQAEFEIYANASDLDDAAVSLIGFPNTDNQIFTWELGSEDAQDRFAFHFRLRIFQFSSTGRCAIEVRFNNNQQAPNQQIVEFCIEAYASDLDRLGKKFETFSRLKDLTMEWSAHPGT